MNQPDLSPVALFTQIAAAIFGASVAIVVGAYVVIAIGAMGGAAVAILQRESTGNLKAFVYFLAMTSFSVLITVNASVAVASIFGGIQAHWLFAPMSFGLGYAAGSPKEVMAWIGKKIGDFVDKLISLREPKP